MKCGTTVVSLLLVVILAVPAASQEGGGLDPTAPYDLVVNWMKPIEPGVTTYVVGVAADGPDRILVQSTGATPGDVGEEYPTFNPKAPGSRLDHLMLVLDRNGKVIEEWRQWFPLWSNPHAARINPYDRQHHVWFLDRARIEHRSADGKLLTYWGSPGKLPGSFNSAHDFTVDSDGNLYIVQSQNHRVEKYLPKPNADHSRLVGQPLK